MCCFPLQSVQCTEHSKINSLDANKKWRERRRKELILIISSIINCFLSDLNIFPKIEQLLTGWFTIVWHRAVLLQQQTFQISLTLTDPLRAVGVFKVTSCHNSIYKAKLSHPVWPLSGQNLLWDTTVNVLEGLNLPEWWSASSCSNRRKWPNPAAQRRDLKVRPVLSLLRTCAWHCHCIYCVYFWRLYLGVHTGDTAVAQLRGNEGVLIICEFTVSGSDIQLSQHNKTRKWQIRHQILFEWMKILLVIWTYSPMSILTHNRGWQDFLLYTWWPASPCDYVSILGYCLYFFVSHKQRTSSAVRLKQAGNSGNVSVTYCT